MRLPPLGVGMGIYLPMALTLLIPIGAVIGYFYDRWAASAAPIAEFAERMGVLAATGLIVGESLWGVAFAGIVAGRRGKRRSARRCVHRRRLRAVCADRRRRCCSSARRWSIRRRRAAVETRHRAEPPTDEHAGELR